VCFGCQSHLPRHPRLEYMETDGGGYNCIQIVHPYIGGWRVYVVFEHAEPQNIAGFVGFCECVVNSTVIYAVFSVSATFLALCEFRNYLRKYGVSFGYLRRIYRRLVFVRT